MNLLKSLSLYEKTYPNEVENIQRIRSFLSEHGAHAFQRELLEGHFTSSAWILHPHLDRVLLTHHRKLNRWLQLGGHADGEMDLLKSALREAEEESGIKNIEILSEDIFDLDIHEIPARKNEPEHFHYDIRFLFRAVREDLMISEESLDLRWLTLEELETFDLDDSVKRMHAKCKKFLEANRKSFKQIQSAS